MEITQVSKISLKNNQLRITSTLKSSVVVLKSLSNIEAVYTFCRAIWEKEAVLPQNPIPEVPPVVETTDYALTAEEWKLLTKGAKTVKYPPNTTIVAPVKIPLEANSYIENETERARYIFRIVSGSCTAKASTHEFILTEGATFGEISFLNGSSVKVDEVITNETTFVSMIEGYYLNALFKYFPELAGKFYRFIAAVLCSRLNVIGYI